MVEMLKQNIRKIRHFTTLVSIVLTVIALGALGFKGLNLGLDFTGGMVTEVKVDKSL
ncbi:protein translocase subunit SecF, partial [Vibrio diabolicus]